MSDDDYMDIEMDEEPSHLPPPLQPQNLLSRLSPSLPAQQPASDLLSRLGAVPDPSGSASPPPGETVEQRQSRLQRLLDTPLGVDPERYHNGLDGSAVDDEAIAGGTDGGDEGATEGGGHALKDRLGRAKVYLLEESATIIHHPVEAEPEVSSAVARTD